MIASARWVGEAGVTVRRSGLLDFVAGHAIHAMAVVAPVLVITGVLFWERFRIALSRRALVRQGAGAAASAPIATPDEPGSKPVHAEFWIKSFAVLWVAAAGIHGAIIGEHFEESFALGAFFVVLAVVQCGYAALIVSSPSRALVRAGLIGELAVVLLWTYTRVVDIPFGLGGREQIGPADSLAVLLELLGAVVAVVILRQSAEPRRIRITRSLVLVAVGSAALAWILAAATAS